MRDGVKIQVAVRADARAILEIQQLAYQSEAILYQDWSIPPLTESAQQLAAEFPRQVFLKAVEESSGRIVGSVRAISTDGVCSIGRLIVRPDFQGRGIGSELLRQIERHFPTAARFVLFTGSRSVQNLRLYQRLGYTPFKEQVLSEKVTLVHLEKTIGNPHTQHEKE